MSGDSLQTLKAPLKREVLHNSYAFTFAFADLFFKIWGK